ncbi:hypothetical protein N7532_011190, partial [Penicillium argentinense]
MDIQRIRTFSRRHKPHSICSSRPGTKLHELMPKKRRLNSRVHWRSLRMRFSRSSLTLSQTSEPVPLAKLAAAKAADPLMVG